jgi:hypothetical protein
VTCSLRGRETFSRWWLPKGSLTVAGQRGVFTLFPTAPQTLPISNAKDMPGWKEDKISLDIHHQFLTRCLPCHSNFPSRKIILYFRIVIQIAKGLPNAMLGIECQ